MSKKKRPIPPEFQTAQMKKLDAELKKNEQKQNALKLKLNKAMSQAREAMRTKQNQQKYILGGDLLRRAREDDKLQALVDQMIHELTRDQDRKNFDLEPLPKNPNSPAKAMKKATT